MAVTRRARGRIGRPAAALALVVSVLAGACGSDDAGSDQTPENDAVAGAAPRLVVAALGDSFASGAGAPPYDPDSGACQRSAGSWSRQLDTDSPAIVSTDHRACGGASTVHLTAGWPDRGLGPQIPVIPEPGVTLVTLVVGGNDIGFSAIVAACVFATCPSTTEAAMVERLHTLRTTLVTAVYPALHAAYPNARIVHVGYPRLTPAPGRPVLDCPWLPAADQVAAAAVIGALNDTIEASTAGGNVTYVDVTDALAEHEMCTETPWLRGLGEESQVHPDADGQAAIELVVARALGIDVSA